MRDGKRLAKIEQKVTVELKRTEHLSCLSAKW